MFLPLVEPLKERSVNSVFVYLDQYLLKENTLPKDSEIQGIEIWAPRIHRKLKSRSGLELLHHYYSWVLPEWRRFLKAKEGGVLVSGQDQEVKIRLLYKEGKKLGFKRVAIQDGYFNPVPLPWGWDVDPRVIQLRNRLLLRTPFAKFVSLSFGSGSEYLGMYGQAVINRYIDAGVLKDKHMRVIGSTRHAIFRERVSEKVAEKTDHSDIQLLFLPRTFRREGDHFYKHQDVALNWIIDLKDKLEKETKQGIILNIKVKSVDDVRVEHYKKICNGADIRFWSGYYCFEELLAMADLAFSCGSSSALDVAVCNKPIIQVMPGLLKKEGIALPDIPIAGNTEELVSLVEEALYDKALFCKKHQSQVENQIADADAAWDSIAECVDWLTSITRA